MARAIFISYRRDDSEGETGRLFDDLVRAFGEDSVFMDVTGINPGTDFRKAIDSNVASCGVLLAVLGPHWVDATDRTGRRRLDDENDFVRLETASALARNIPVIPVLVHGAKMPVPDQLPDNLKDLAYRNSVEITHARWNSDVALLTKALTQYVGAATADTQPVHATVPVQLPPPSGGDGGSTPAQSSKTGLIAGLAAAAVLVVGLGAYFGLHKSNPEPRPPVPISGQGRPVRTAEDGALLGKWTSSEQLQNNTLSRLQVTRSGGGLMMHAWGACAGCDWGEQPAEVNGRNATAAFHLGMMGGEREDRTAIVTIASEDPNLEVVVKNQYPGGRTNGRRSTFARAQ